MEDRPSYATEQTWRHYAAVVPDVARSQQLVAEEWWDWNGLRVHIDRSANERAEVKVIMVHGIGGYGRLVIGPFGLPLADAGFEVVAPDLPGYGLTAVPSKRLTWQLWVNAVSALIDREIARDHRPIALYGLSLGGVVAYHAAASRPQVAALAATTLIDLRDRDVLAGVSRWRALARLGLPLSFRMHAITDPIRLPARFLAKMDAISNDPALADLCGRDPRGGATQLPMRFFRTAAGADPALEPEDFDRPVLVVHPADDRMTDIAFTRRFVRRLGDRARFVELEGCGHFPIEQPGAQVLNDTLIGFFNDLADR